MSSSELGQIGQAIARRVGVGKHVLLADMRPENANGVVLYSQSGKGRIEYPPRGKNSGLDARTRARKQIETSALQLVPR